MGGDGFDARVEAGYGKGDASALAGGGECDARAIDRIVSCQEIDGSDEVGVGEMVVMAIGLRDSLEEIAWPAEEDLHDGVAALAFVEHDALLLAPVAGSGHDGREFTRRRTATDG